MPFSKGGGGITQLTGDATAGLGDGSQVLTLASVTTAETVGDASHYPVVTTDAKGRVTGMTATAVPAGVSPATTVTGPDAYGAAAVVGSSTEYARADHDHGLPVAPTPSLSSFQNYISTTVSGSSTGWLTVITSTTTFQTGTYLVFLGTIWEAGSGGAGSIVGSGEVQGGTGTATSVAIIDTSGSGNGIYLATVGAIYQLNTTLLVTVTAAGTLGFACYIQPSGGATMTCQIGSGFIAVKIG